MAGSLPPLFGQLTGAGDSYPLWAPILFPDQDTSNIEKAFMTPSFKMVRISNLIITRSILYSYCFYPAIEFYTFQVTRIWVGYSKASYGPKASWKSLGSYTRDTRFDHIWSNYGTLDLSRILNLLCWYLWIGKIPLFPWYINVLKLAVPSRQSTMLKISQLTNAYSLPASRKTYWQHFYFSRCSISIFSILTPSPQMILQIW